MGGRTLGWRFECLVVQEGPRRILPIIGRGSCGLQAIKEALLKRYDLTEDGYQLKFRKSRPESAEKPNQFIHRLNNYLLEEMDDVFKV